MKSFNYRVDTTLIGFKNIQWQRGNISMVFRSEGDNSRLVLLDHQTKTIEQIWPKDFTIPDLLVQEELSAALNTSIRSGPEIDWSSVSVVRAKTGYIWKVNSFS